MIYVALLRAINVGGKNKVSMPILKEGFESLGFTNVVTYINSGNIIFVDEGHSIAELEAMIGQLIFELFDLEISVLVRSKEAIDAVVKEIQPEWIGNKAIVSNIFFLFDEIDDEKILEKFIVKEAIDHVWYIPGTVIWIVPRELHSKSGASRFIGQKEYRLTTIRNANTTVKIAEIMQEIASN